MVGTGYPAIGVLDYRNLECQPINRSPLVRREIVIMVCGITSDIGDITEERIMRSIPACSIQFDQPTNLIGIHETSRPGRKFAINKYITRIMQHWHAPVDFVRGYEIEFLPPKRATHEPIASGAGFLHAPERRMIRRFRQRDNVLCPIDNFHFKNSPLCCVCIHCTLILLYPYSAVCQPLKQGICVVFCPTPHRPTRRALTKRAIRGYASSC